VDLTQDGVLKIGGDTREGLVLLLSQRHVVALRQHRAEKCVPESVLVLSRQPLRPLLLELLLVRLPVDEASYRIAHHLRLHKFPGGVHFFAVLLVKECLVDEGVNQLKHFQLVEVEVLEHVYLFNDVDVGQPPGIELTHQEECVA